MYKKILVALENGRADETLIRHVGELAGLLGSEILLVHVADGWAARNYDQLKLAESDEMRADREYLAGVAERLRDRGLTVHSELALGNPPAEIVRSAGAHRCDLIAMGAHGHKLVGDIFLGSTIDRVRHNTTIPVLVVRVAGASTPPLPQS
ncbi:universal stress protein [Opitutus sp. ER46]|uniref:universal stress protein n=1 Tax=Opitutus sp. ER46 TaxID=2161864 RepID=UPI000D30893A|nr:universal stress protein [Opitutus sp. ER46]PTX99014.1 universal stress protein [Opitutus sp. ER46]